MRLQHRLLSPGDQGPNLYTRIDWTHLNAIGSNLCDRRNCNSSLHPSNGTIMRNLQQEDSLVLVRNICIKENKGIEGIHFQLSM
jgi:hypothetical protein